MTRLLCWNRGALIALSVCVLLAVSGCTKSTDNPVGAGIGVGTQVHLAMKFSKGASGISLSKTSGTAEADSIRIDSIVVVVEKIHLHSASDTVAMGGGGHNGDGEGDNGGEGDHGGDGNHGGGDFDKVSDSSSSVTLDGPFIIHVRDSLSVDFANQTVPAGTYNDISFIIHRIHDGDEGFDSDDHRMKMVSPADSSLMGSSVVIWGAVLKNGTWTPFQFNSDLELKVNIPGTFVVPMAISSVTLAFNFDVSQIFRDPATGQFLDPTDTSMFNHEQINRAIAHAFGSGRCGDDFNHDGWADH